MNDNNQKSCLTYIIGFFIFYACVVFIENTFGAAGTIGIIIFLCCLFRKTLGKIISFLFRWGIRVILSCILTFPMLYFIMLASDALALGHGKNSMIFIIGSYVLVCVAVYLLLIKPFLERHLAKGKRGE